MKFLSYGVMVYMLLALIWWTILLSKNNKKLYEKNKEIAAISNKVNLKTSEDEIYNDYLRNKYMIIGEGLVFGISLILGMWFIQKAYNREVKYTSNQKNFLLSITHELKSPLAAINLISETILKRKLPEEKVLDLQKSVLSESSRLEKLINNLLLTTKIDSGYQYNFEPCSLSKIIKESANRVLIQNQDIDLNLEIPNHEVFIMADKESIFSVINNLLENSIKYTYGNPKINVILNQNNDSVTLSVADNGIGIPNKEKEKVLEQFYRIGNEERRQTKGTGLGLYIVNKIVTAHQAKIKIEDNKPNGTIISVTFPNQQS